MTVLVRVTMFISKCAIYYSHQVDRNVLYRTFLLDIIIYIYSLRYGNALQYIVKWLVYPWYRRVPLMLRIVCFNVYKRYFVLSL